MNDNPPSADAGPRFVTVDLETPLKRADQVITTVTLRKPTGGDLRGAPLSDVMRLDIVAISKVVPRISDPIIHAPEFLAMDGEDILAISAEVAGFLLTRRQKAEAGLDQ